MPSSGRGTRRGFIGGVAAAGAAHVLVGPAAAAGEEAAVCEPQPPGTPVLALAATPDGRTVWSADLGTTITAHRVRDLARRRSIDVGGTPVDIAISPRGDLALVVIASRERPGLAIVDLVTREVDRVDVGPEPRSVAFAPGGRHAWVAGGGAQGTLTRVALRTGRLGKPIALGAHPRGLAITPDGDHAVVALHGDAAVALVRLATRRVRRIPTRPYPARVAVAPHGRRAVVTHDGFSERRVTPVDLEARRARRPIRVGADPGGVAYAGRRAAVTLAGGVKLLGGRTARIAGRPRAIAVAGRRVIVADGETGRLTKVRAR